MISSRGKKYSDGLKKKIQNKVNLTELSSSPQGTLGQIIHSFLSIRVRFLSPYELAKCTQIYWHIILSLLILLEGQYKG